MKIERELHYDDIYLIPQKSVLNSRSEADLTMTLGNHTFDLPIIPANMKSVVSEGTCEYLIRKNIFYVMHRICSNDNIYDFVKDFNEKDLIVSISIGIKDKDIEMLKRIKNDGLRVDYITIDVAHCHNDLTLKMIDECKDIFPNTYLIVGNIATGEAVKFFAQHGKVDALRSGISMGNVCITKNATGFNRRMVSTLLECNDASNDYPLFRDGKIYNIPIIADGGIKENGDYIKALNCGKNIIGVMAGSMFAGFEESAGDILVVNDKKQKQYYGNASENAKGNRIHVEGVTRLIDYKGDMEHYISEVSMALSSSVSYSGKSRVCDVYDVKMVRIK
jgi:GMP reductase